MNQLSTNYNCTLSSSVFRMCHPQDMYVEKGLPSYDDKRYWLNGIYSLSFGHYKIKDL